MLFDIDTLFPFMRHAQRFVGDRVETLSRKDIVAPFYNYPEFPVSAATSPIRNFHFYKLHSLGIYVLGDYRLSVIRDLNRQLYSGASVIRAKVSLVDYDEILRFITLDEEEKRATLDISDFPDSVNIHSETFSIINAWYQKNAGDVKSIANAFLTQDILQCLTERKNAGLEHFSPDPLGIASNSVAQDSQSNSISTATSPLSLSSSLVLPVRAIGEQSSEEDTGNWSSLDEAPLAGITNKRAPSRSGGGVDETEIWLKDYLLKRYAIAEKVPALLGPTAVAKSSLVKALAKELGFRFVDFRCAFVEKTDIEGMKKYTVDPDTGKPLSYSASMDKMITATDDWQEYAEEKYAQVVAYLQNTPNIPDEEKKQIEILKGKFEEWKKPVLLFFDEINRAPNTVLAAFTAILNQKNYNNHFMKNARLVAAANAPIGLSPKVRDEYVTTEVVDVSISQRFEYINVQPKDVFPRWRKYIESHGWHQSVIDFVDKEDIAYSVDALDEVYSKNDSDKAALSPFPNYRTWEYISNHMGAVEKKQDFFNPVLITNLIGENPVSAKFLNFLNDKYSQLVAWKEDPSAPKRDEFTKGILCSVGSNVPMMMIAPTSYGKTWRLNKVCKEKGLGEPFVVNMAQKDRIDVMGTPTTIGVGDYMTEEIGLKLKDHPLIAQLRDEGDILKHNLPAEISVYAPDMDFSNKLKKLKSGQKIVVFFDELNKGDKSAMSAVFEAISDNRLFGTTFEPGQVVVVSALNYGPAYGNSQAIDSAFSARFAMYHKETIDDDDVDGFIASIKAEGFSHVIVDYLTNKSKQEMIQMFMSVERAEDGGFGKSFPNFRAWRSMNDGIKLVDRLLLSGSVIDADGSLANRFLQPLPRDTKNVAAALKKLFDLIPTNWAGFDSGVEALTFNKVKYTAKEFVDSLKDTVDALEKGDYDNEDINSLAKNLRDSFSELLGFDQHVKDFRRGAMEKWIGPDYADDFADFYNKMMGKESLELKDIIDEAKAVIYIKKVFALQPDQLKVIDRLTRDALEHADLFKEKNMQQAYFMGLVDVIMNDMQLPDFFLRLMSVGESNDNFYKWCEFVLTDVPFAVGIMDVLGVTDPDTRKNVLDYNKSKIRGNYP